MNLTLYTDSCVSNYVLESLFDSSKFLKRPYNNSKIKKKHLIYYQVNKTSNDLCDYINK